MHAQELAYLDGLEHGKLNTAKANDVMMATPRILDLIKHDDPALMDTLCPGYVYMSGADSLIRYRTLAAFFAASLDTVSWPVDAYIDTMRRAVPNPHDLRDTYWHLLHKIDAEAHTHNAGRVMGWLLDQYTTPLYPHFTNREATRRYNAREQKRLSYIYSKDIRPLPRRSKRNVVDSVYNIMRWAVQHNDRDLALKAAHILKTDFAHAYRSEYGYIEPYAMNFDRGALAEVENASDPVSVLENKFKLLDEIDAVMGTKRTRYSFIASNLIKALASENEAIRTFFIQHAADLTPEEKEDFLDERMMLCLDGKDIGVRSKHIFFHRHPDVLNRFLDVLKSWDKGDRKKSYQKNFWGGVAWAFGYGRKKNKTGYIAHYSGIGDFDAPLKWDDVQQRLQLFAQATRYKLKPFTLDDPHYWECAVKRALEFGHAKELSQLIQKDKTAGETERFGLHYLGYGKLASRDIDTLRVVTQAVLEADDFSRRMVAKLIKLAQIPLSEDRYRECSCSFYKDGYVMDKQDYFKGIPVVMDAIRTLYERTDEDGKKDIITELFGDFESTTSSGLDYSSMSDTLRTLQDNCDMDAVMAITSFWYDIACSYYKGHIQRLVLDKIAEAAFSQWNSADDSQDVQRFMRLVVSHDKDDAWFCLNRAGNARFAVSAEDIYKPITLLRMFTEILPEEEKHALDAPHVRTVFRRMERIDKNRDVWQQADFIPHNNSFLIYPPTNFDAAMYDRFLPVMKTYSSIENSRNAEMDAFKFACLFPTVNKASRYLHNHGQGAQAVHDACLFVLPEEGRWDKELWANLAVRWGNGALRWLPFAPQLEAAVAAMNEGKHPRTHFKLSECKPADIRALVQEHCAFKNKAENPELAEALLDNGVPENYFDETLDMLRAYNAQKDDLPPRKMPELQIDGADVGMPGYRLETLPQGDFKNLWMGQYVNCCMHLANQGRNLAIAMFNDAAAAAYVIRKGDEIVGALHSWLSRDGNLVFNSWQPKTSDHDFLRTAFVEAAANKALAAEPSIGRVVMGQGHIKPEEVPYEYIEGNLYFDYIAKNGGDVNRDGDHYTADTQVGQFIIASRGDKPENLTP